MCLGFDIDLEDVGLHQKHNSYEKKVGTNEVSHYLWLNKHNNAQNNGDDGHDESTEW